MVPQSLGHRESTTAADGEAITGAIDAEVIRSLSKKTGKHSGTHATQAPVSDPRDSR
ncbi:hypothetical protein [Kocuria sp.]|uniref:hypothetical protein n=1 Tax=Kocuria sp. TaxID=1871328 RepID=UPI0026DF57DC|nr:hypothetical protein [Kocuria sp.]MDO5368665.1 hypothetical protein [Kocuria sp.]